METVFGIGLDLIDLAHFKTHYGDEDPDLMARCFTPVELKAAGDGVDRLAKLAARYAAKEATFKALGGGEGVALCHIETRVDSEGAPRIVLEGAAKSIAEARGVVGFLVSLTHSPASAAAVVIAFSAGPK